MTSTDAPSKRETFASNFGLLMTMIGVAVGLGNVWRFPYMVGRFGGAAFVAFYLLVVLCIGIPALMAEWALGRHTQRGTLGAFERGGFPGGKYLGALLFGVVVCATGYYSNTIGWVGYFGLGELIQAFGGTTDAASILPPQSGFNATSFVLQLIMTAVVIATCGLVLVKGLRRGIEKVSRFVTPILFAILLILIVRSTTLEGAGEGVRWYLGGFHLSDLKGSVMAAAMGQAIFSLSLGGTFMVVYGSYLDRTANIPRNALFTGIGDTLAGVLAGLAIFPAVFALGMEPSSGPGLIFSSLPQTFARMPAGWLFGLFFFVGLFGAAYLSDVAAFEVLVAGIVDNTRVKRGPAVAIICSLVFLVAIPPMINLEVFVHWDLTFGSGMQTVGAFCALVTTVWFINRSSALGELSTGSGIGFYKLLYWWMRIVIPFAILFVGVSWLLEAVWGVDLFR